MGFVERANEVLAYSIGSFTLGGLLSAVLVFIVCLAAIKFLSRLVARALERSKIEGALRAFVSSCVKAVLWVITALIIADKLGIPSASLVAAVSVAGLAL